MYITYDELRDLKHLLPTGSVKLIASQLDISENRVRNFFGGNRKDPSVIVDLHRQPGPNGGLYYTDETKIIELARRIISYRTRH